MPRKRRKPRTRGRIAVRVSEAEDEPSPRNRTPVRAATTSVSRPIKLKDYLRSFNVRSQHKLQVLHQQLRRLGIRTVDAFTRLSKDQIREIPDTILRKSLLSIKTQEQRRQAEQELKQQEDEKNNQAAAGPSAETLALMAELEASNRQNVALQARLNEANERERQFAHDETTIMEQLAETERRADEADERARLSEEAVRESERLYEAQIEARDMQAEKRFREHAETTRLALEAMQVAERQRATDEEAMLGKLAQSQRRSDERAAASEEAMRGVEETCQRLQKELSDADSQQATATVTLIKTMNHRDALARKVTELETRSQELEQLRDRLTSSLAKVTGNALTDKVSELLREHSRLKNQSIQLSGQKQILEGDFMRVKDELALCKEQLVLEERQSIASIEAIREENEQLKAVMMDQAQEVNALIAEINQIKSSSRWAASSQSPARRIEIPEEPESPLPLVSPKATLSPEQEAEFDKIAAEYGIDYPEDSAYEDASPTACVHRCPEGHGPWEDGKANDADTEHADQYGSTSEGPNEHEYEDVGTGYPPSTEPPDPPVMRAEDD